MKSLFIDTSNMDVSIALVENNKIINSICDNVPNMHSVYTVPYIKMVLDNSNLEPNDIDNILVVNGPGSFTGIRIGLTIAKIYGYSLKKDVITVSSLKALALSTKGEYIMALISARNDNYYVGLYDKYYSEIIDEHFANISEIKNIIKLYSDLVIVGYDDIKIGRNVCHKTYLDIVNIVKYYGNEKVENIHSINSNYLKLPQAVEAKND